jgi:hypothetical protein
MERDRVQRARTFLLLLALIAFALSSAARSRGPFSSGLTHSADGPSCSHLRPGRNEPIGPGAAWAEAGEMGDASRSKLDARLNPLPSGTSLPASLRLSPTSETEPGSRFEHTFRHPAKWVPRCLQGPSSNPQKSDDSHPAA